MHSSWNLSRKTFLLFILANSMTKTIDFLLHSQDQTEIL